MKQLVILSGKGGTGKTSITGALATFAGNSVLVDGDVDASNLHLILRPEIKERHEFSAGEKAEIERDLCTGCGVCYECCRFDAILKDESSPDTVLPIYTVDSLSCEGCAVCSHVCLDGAVRMIPVVSGEWFRSETAFGPMVHGRLGIAEANSGKLVALLRTTARSIADEQHRDTIIIDGPPGIGCPTIAALTGTDYALLVTEPTVSAFQDLKRIVQLIRHFNLSAGICINKYDINMSVTAQIEEFGAREEIEILEKLPYDEVVTRAQVAAKTITEFDTGTVSHRLRCLWSILSRRLEESAAHSPADFQSQTENKKRFGV